jgi:hypothetical protein
VPKKEKSSMPITIKDADIDNKIRDLAILTGESIAEAVRIAIEQRLRRESQVAQSAVDRHESQVAQSAVDRHESQVAQSAVDRHESPRRRAGVASRLLNLSLAKSGNKRFDVSTNDNMLGYDDFGLPTRLLMPPR